jgi:predicted ATP-grasp superfamily ATP-dependent carboligase
MTRKRILVADVSSDAGSSVLRQLSESGYGLIGADWRRLPFGLRSRYLRIVHLLPKPTDIGFGRSLFDLVNSVRPDVFLPLGIYTVATACRLKQRLRSVTAINIPDYDAYLAAFDKAFCNRECRELGIPCPASYSPEEAAGILAGSRERAVLVVKPGTDAGMALGVTYVQDAEVLRRSVSLCMIRFGSVTIQEYIPGDASHMRTAVLLFDRHSELIAAFTMQKLRQWPSTGGVTALSTSTDEFHLVEQALPFFRKWRWQGVAEVEFKFDARDRSYKVIEINPRFPGYQRFAMTCGLPLARLAARLALEDENIAPLKYPSYSVGMKFVNPGLFLRTTLADMRPTSVRASALRRAIADLVGTGPAVAGMLKDPLPMIGRLQLDILHLCGRSSSPSLYAPVRETVKSILP